MSYNTSDVPSIPMKSRRVSFVPYSRLISLLVALLAVQRAQAFVSPYRILQHAPCETTLTANRRSHLIEKDDLEAVIQERQQRQIEGSLAAPVNRIGELPEVPIPQQSEVDAATNDDDKDSFEWPITIMLLLWGVTFLSALDRVAMSVAMLPLSTEFGYTESIKGQVSSLFSVGYGIGILPIGIALSTVSSRLIMGVGIALWSLATMATPATAAGGIAVMMPLLLTRAAVGAAESVVLPTMQRVISEWIPADRKSVAVAIIFSGFHAGTVAAYLASPYVMDWTGGWRGLFVTYGALGLALLVPWLLYARDSPVQSDSLEKLRSLGDGSDILIASDLAGDDTDAPPLQKAIDFFQSAPLSEMLSSKGAQAILIAHAANNWGLYNNLAWTPTFYAEQYGLNVKDSALYSILPSAAGAIGGFLAGVAADSWLRQDPNCPDERTTQIRKIFQGVALYGPAVFLSVLAYDIPEQPWVAQSLLTGSVGLSAFNSAGYGPAVQEKAGSKWSGLLYSLTSLPGVMLGSLGVYATGQILDLTNQDWSVVFSMNALVDVVGATGFVLLYNATKEFD
jgi:ACS family sodium-dependent inorganic phosphate cotransporter